MNEAYLKFALDRVKLAQSQTSLIPNVGAFCVYYFGCVFIAITDPIPSTGIRFLRVANNETITCNDEADVNNQAFNLHQLHYINVKDAATLDGRLAMQNGNSKWRQNLHSLVATHDANRVDVYTILQNNPFLTTRLPHGGKNPIQLIVNRHLRTPLTIGPVFQDPAFVTSNFTLTSNEMRTNTDFPIQKESIPEMMGGVC